MVRYTEAAKESNNGIFWYSTYNYYPRGRIDWDNQERATIYMNSNNPEDLINLVKSDFGIRPLMNNCLDKS